MMNVSSMFFASALAFVDVKSHGHKNTSCYSAAGVVFGANELAL